MARNSFSSHSSAGVTLGSWSRSRCTSCTANAGVSFPERRFQSMQRIGIDGLSVDSQQPIGDQRPLPAVRRD